MSNEARIDANGMFYIPGIFDWQTSVGGYHHEAELFSQE
jgi:hypothetical protein